MSCYFDSYFLSGKQAAVLGTGPGQRPGGQGRNLPVTDQSRLQEMGTFQGGRLLWPHPMHSGHAEYMGGQAGPWLCWRPSLESDSAEFKFSQVSFWHWHQPRACLIPGSTLYWGWTHMPSPHHRADFLWCHLRPTMSEQEKAMNRRPLTKESRGA